MDWFPDGRAALVRLDRPQTLADLWVVPLGVGGQATPYLATAASEFSGRFSPDGKWVAYSSDESGRSEVYVQAFPRGGGKLRISQSGGALPEWGPSGRELFFLSPDNHLVSVFMVASGGALKVGVPTALFQAPSLGGTNSITQYRREYAASPDGRFLMNAVLPVKISPTITVIQNWTPPQP